MSRTMETLSTLNSLIRTLLALGVVGVLGYGGWSGYSLYRSQERAAEQNATELVAARKQLEETEGELNRAKSDLDAKNLEIASLGQRIKELDEKIARLDTALRLLKVNHRLARLTAVDQTLDTSGEEDQLYSIVEFEELNDDGQPIDEPRQFRIKGDVVYLDNWIVKFDDKYIEQSDLDRSTSLVLFRRIFGEFQNPNDGYLIDESGVRPTAYARGGRMSEFERKIWNDFWNIANDPAAARDLGIRAAHGDAVSIKVQKGKSYRVMLRASDGLSIVPEEAPADPPTGSF